MSCHICDQNLKIGQLLDLKIRVKECCGNCGYSRPATGEMIEARYMGRIPTPPDVPSHTEYVHIFSFTKPRRCPNCYANNTGEVTPCEDGNSGINVTAEFAAINKPVEVRYGNDRLARS